MKRLTKKMQVSSAWKLGSLIAVVLGASLVWAADKGVWVKAGEPAQINVACTQVWACTAGQDILHGDDTFVWTTDRKITTGICSAAGGPVDGCNVCVVGPPKEACEWELRKKPK